MATAATSLWNRIVKRGGSPYYYARKWSEIGSTAGTYMRRRNVGAALADGINDSDRKVVEELRTAGYVILPQPLDYTDELVAECRRRLDAHMATRAQGPSEIDESKKFFWASLLENQKLDTDSIFIKYAAQERLVAMAARYLGEAPYLSDISVQYSFETPQKGPTHSQLWHRDYDDTKLFKVFVYCTDVNTEEEGAFHVADRRAIRGIYATPLYSSRRFTDDQFYKMADQSQTLAIKGPTGTTFICDTRNAFHYGSRCTRPRLACWLTYQSYAGLYPAAHVTDPPANADERLKLLLAKTPN